MRLAVLMLSLMIVIPAAAQERGVRRYPPDWASALPQYERRVQMLTAGIKRDAFLIGRVTLAKGDLTDEFQKRAAIQKAYERIEEANLRAAREPTASLRTLTALSKMTTALEDGRRQGTSADLEALRTTVSRESEIIRYDLFTALNEARGERQNLVELLNKVQTMNADLEGAMIEALGTTFSYMGVGGK